MDTIRIEKNEGVAVVTLDRVARKNAINEQMLRELGETFRGFDGNREIRCIVITGNAEGRAFAAGADIAAMEKMDYERAKAFAQLGCETFQMLETMDQPVIAAINGYALGGGMELALACDIRVAAEHAKMGLPETTLGVMPGFGGTERLGRLAGYGRAAEMIFTGKVITAQDAQKMGIINECWEEDVFWENTMKLARVLCRNAPLGIRNAKKAMKQSGGYAVENLYFAQLFLTKDQKTGMNDFVNKRKTKHFSGE